MPGAEQERRRNDHPSYSTGQQLLHARENIGGLQFQKTGRGGQITKPCGRQLRQTQKLPRPVRIASSMPNK
jgi:hypothetical protein